MNLSVNTEPHLEVKYGIPRQVQYCIICTASNQRPGSSVEFVNQKGSQKIGLYLDDQGVCAACRFFQTKKTLDWKKRSLELEKLLDQHRRNNGSYDCIVPGSGGKDSRFISHILKAEYGMHPLTVTWAPQLYTEIGWKNFQSWIHAGADNILFTPNGKVHRYLTRLAFLNLLHPFQPFILGQKNIGPKMALRFRIPLVIYGEHLAEYGKGPDIPLMDPSFYSAEALDLDRIHLGGVSASELMRSHNLSRADIDAYFPASRNELSQLNIEVHCLSYYLNWDPQENYYYAVEKTGFEANTERTEGTYSKYSSIDDVLDFLHYYTTYIKFGMGRASYDAEQEVRTGKITRDEAISLIRRYDGEFPKKYFKEILAYLEISEDQFYQSIEEGRSPHLWEKRQGEWKLRHPVS